MFWAGEKIDAFFRDDLIVYTLDANGIRKSVYDEKRLDCNAYQLTVGREYFITQDKDSKFLPHKGIDFLGVSADGTAREGIMIPSGQFGFLVTAEIVNIPKNVMGFISLRTKSAKFRGLVNVSGFHVDPGYDGHLTFAVFNAGPSPIHMKRGDPLFLLWIADIDVSKDRKTFSQETKSLKSSNLGLSTDIICNVTDPVVSLQDMSKRIFDLDRQIHDLGVKVNYILMAGGIIITSIGLLANWNSIFGLFE